MFITDVIRATFLGIEKEEANGQVFNVGTGIPTTVLEVAEGLIALYGKEVPVKVSGNYRLGDIRHNYADMKKTAGLLGFTPAVSFSEGLRQFTEWVTAQGVKTSRYDESIAEMKAKGLMK